MAGTRPKARPKGRERRAGAAGKRPADVHAPARRPAKGTRPSRPAGKRPRTAARRKAAELSHPGAAGPQSSNGFDDGSDASQNLGASGADSQGDASRDDKQPSTNQTHGRAGGTQGDGRLGAGEKDLPPGTRHLTKQTGGGGGDGDATVYARNQAQLAHVLGVSVQHVQRWLAAGGPAKKSKGYDLSEWCRYRFHQLYQTAGTVDHQLKQVKLQREQLALRRELGQVVDVEVVRQDRLELLNWMLAVFERAGAELGSRLAGKRPSETRRIVDDYFTNVRLEAAGSED